MDRKKAMQIANLLYKLEDIECFKDELKHFLETYENNNKELYAELLQVVTKYKEKLEAQLEEM